jgi:G3E family GTPase
VVNSLTTVADAKKCKSYMKNFGEFYNNQVETAGTIILSRTADIKPERLEQTMELLKEKNSNAIIVTTPWDQLDGSKLLSTMEGAEVHAEHLLDDACPVCGHHHDEDHHHHEEHEHHHDHEECGCGHHHDHEEHEHHHDHEECGCGHHHDHEGHHHHHHADDVFTSWGLETSKKFTKEEISTILGQLPETVLRAKGMVPAEDGTWIYFDYVPEEMEIRDGSPEVCGKICVIGSKMDEASIAKLFK